MSETTIAVIEKPAASAPALPAPRRGTAGRAARLLGTGVRRVVAIAAFLALWQLAPTVGWVDPAFLSPLSEVLHTWWGLAVDGDLWTNIWASLHRSLSGFAIAISVAVPLGLLVAWYRAVAGVLSPLLAVFLNTAAVALLPVFTLILGIGDTSKIAIIAYACFWPVLYNTISGARDVDPLLIKSARSLGLPHLKLFAKVIVPAALPTIFTGIRLAGAASMLVLITTEYVGAKAGLGYMIISAQFNFQIPEMYAGILTVSIIGVAFNYLLLFIESKVLRWRA
ncbi:ABC transporter permease [Dactylosporangium sp. NPDC049140]|uniref:ABC transporter permease n=1 Tax=Dactylosporangium sp. NPDC049140 TaxID=3155647 RepID=UPI0033C3EF28